MKRQEMIHRENTPAQELELHPEEVRENTFNIQAAGRNQGTGYDCPYPAGLLLFHGT